MAFLDFNNNIQFTARMEHDIFFKHRDRGAPHDNLYFMAYRNFMRRMGNYIDKQVIMAEHKVMWILFYVFAPPLYIYAAASNFDTWKAVLLFLIMGCTGIIALARLAVKFFKELLDVLVAYREKQVSIEGAKHLWIIISLLCVILLLVVAILYLAMK